MVAVDRMTKLLAQIRAKIALGICYGSPGSIGQPNGRRLFPDHAGLPSMESAAHTQPQSHMNDEKALVNNALEATIRIGLLILLAAWCFEIVKPFAIPIAWGIIIAAGTYPAYFKLTRRLEGKRKLAATFIALVGFVLLLIPAFLLGGTLIDSAHGFAEGFQDGKIALPPPVDVYEDMPYAIPRTLPEIRASLGSYASIELEGEV